MNDRTSDAARTAVAAFADRHGRRPRLLVAGSPGQHADPGIAAALADLGCDVDMAAPADAVGLAGQAVDDDVHAVVLTSADSGSARALRNALANTGILLATAAPADGVDAVLGPDPARGLVDLLDRIPDDPA